MNSNSDEPTTSPQPGSDAGNTLSESLLGIYRPAVKTVPPEPSTTAAPGEVAAQASEVHPEGVGDAAQLSPLAVARLLAARYSSGNSSENGAPRDMDAPQASQESELAAEQGKAEIRGNDAASDQQAETVPEPVMPGADEQPQEKPASLTGMNAALTDHPAPRMPEVPEVKVHTENLEALSVTDPQTADPQAGEAVETDLAHPVTPDLTVSAPSVKNNEEVGAAVASASMPGSPVPITPERSVTLPPEASAPVPSPVSALRGTPTSAEAPAVTDLRARTRAAIHPAATRPSPAPSAEVVALRPMEAAVPENVQPVLPARAAPSAITTPATAPLPSVPEVDPTAQMMGNIWRSRWPILGAALLTSVLAYGLSSMQKPNYVATASLASTLPSANDVVGASVVTAPVLASGAMNQALQGPELTKALIGRVSKLTVAEDVKQAMLGSLQRHLNGQGASPVWVEGFEGDKVNNGLYQVSGRATTAAAAQTLANTAAAAVLAWDVERAREQLGRARTSIQGQLRALEKDTPNNDLYDSAHEAARSRLLQNLAVTGAAQESAVGTLELVSEAMQPARPLSPKPLRQALLSGLLALLVAAGLAAFLGGRARQP